MSISAPQIAEQLKRLLPPGPAFTRDADTTLHKLLLALSDEMARVYGRRDDLLQEMFPSTVDELLPEWEEEYGLPDPCVEAAQTVAERIAALVAKVTGSGGQSIQFYIDLAARLGLAITITEQTAFYLGVHGMGHPIGGTEWNFVWRVTAPPWATTAQRQQLECLFTALKPAHTVVQFQYPELALDFTSSSAPAEVEFSRLGEKYYEDQNGLLAAAPADVWPLEYRAGVPIGRSVWEARTNWLQQSETFSSGVWSRGSAIAVTDDAITAPDGTLSADRIAALADSNTVVIQEVAAFASQDVAYSIYCRQDTGPEDANSYLIRDATTGTNLIRLAIDTATGVATYDIGSGPQPTDAGGGWWRVQISMDAWPVGHDILMYAAFTGGGNNGESSYNWGAMLESAPFAGPYIDTAGSPVTRPAESARINLLGAWWDPAGSTIVIDCDAAGGIDSDQHYLSLHNGSVHERMRLYRRAADRHLVWQHTIAGTPVITLDLGLLADSDSARVAISVDPLDCRISRDGGSIIAATPSGLPYIDRLDIGQHAGAEHCNSVLREIRIDPFMRTDAELQELSQ